LQDNGDLFTGPGIRSLANDIDPSAVQNIFVLAKFNNTTPLKKGAIIIHQVLIMIITIK
jgi:hypothetical protein